MKKINIGLIGFGTIGSGVAKALIERRSSIREKTGVDLVLKRICDKDLKTKRPVKVPRSILTKSAGKVLYDPDIDIVIELMGGITPAKDFVLEALRNGKHVVTANKAMLSECGKEVFGLANTLGLSVGFEASVGGGIPIIRALNEGFVANKFDLICGIINGTSNFILTKMAEEGLGFREALKLAQEAGYAERDPYLDISGGDSRHKLAILALLGFGATAAPGDIYTEGIVGIEPEDIRYAKEAGYSIKLLAIAKMSGGALELRVHPTLIANSHLLTNVGGVYNAIFVRGDLIGENLFYGQGAGALPTSSAVVSDVVAIAKTISGKCRKCRTIGAAGESAIKVRSMDEIKTRFYVRFSTVDKPGVLAKISGVLAKYKISIASVIQKEKRGSAPVPIIMMTYDAFEKDMKRALKEIDALGIVKKKSVRIRIEG